MYAAKEPRKRVLFLAVRFMKATWSHYQILSFMMRPLALWFLSLFSTKKHVQTFFEISLTYCSTTVLCLVLTFHHCCTHLNMKPCCRYTVVCYTLHTSSLTPSTTYI